MQFLEQISTVTSAVPDSFKVGVSVSSPVLTFLGFPVEQWGYVLSAVVALLFIIEKIPMVVKNIKSFVRWVKNVRSSRNTR